MANGIRDTWTLITKDSMESTAMTIIFRTTRILPRKEAIMKAKSMDSRKDTIKLETSDKIK